jgi:chromosome segregation ATPase
MSKMLEIVDSLEDKLSKLIIRYEDLETSNAEIASELTILRNKLAQKNEEMLLLQKSIENLQMTNSLLGSDTFKRDTKLKINTLIREIDYCITQLSD